ncbi:MAG: flavodoxin [Acetatifactor sp.]|nr:flavodoxin [Acetatifactor sp.]
MKVEVRYFSRTGNTKKLADAIAEVAGVEAKRMDEPITEATDILFLGSSVYAAGVDQAVKEFIKSLQPEKIKKVVNFSTAALLPSTYKQISKLLEAQGISLDTREFHCRGSFQMMHRGKPDENDIQEVKRFTKSIIE